jgi:hypothetical protein
MRSASLTIVSTRMFPTTACYLLDTVALCGQIISIYLHTISEALGLSASDAGEQTTLLNLDSWSDDKIYIDSDDDDLDALLPWDAKPMLAAQLAEWAVLDFITQSSLSKLLPILHPYQESRSLDTRILLKTPRNFESRSLPVNEGLFL